MLLGKLKPHQLKMLVDAINKQLQKQKVFFMLQFLHGTRIDETSLAEYAHFSVDTLGWYLPEENTKGKKSTDYLLPSKPLI